MFWNRCWCQIDEFFNLHSYKLYVILCTIKNAKTCRSNIISVPETWSDTNPPVSRWSPSPPRSKQRRRGFGSGWPVRYAYGFTAKTGRSSTPGFNYTSAFHNIIRSMVKKHCLHDFTGFYKELGNTVFPMNNIIQSLCDNKEAAFQDTVDIGSTMLLTACERQQSMFSYNCDSVKSK